jgi:NAD(P)-dependent dehydrogenase (short-subunit alcohol dehydrogenase family)
MKVDLTVEADVLAMIATCKDQLGGLNFLVQNAAARSKSPCT